MNTVHSIVDETEPKPVFPAGHPISRPHTKSAQARRSRQSRNQWIVSGFKKMNHYGEVRVRWDGSLARAAGPSNWPYGARQGARRSLTTLTAFGARTRTWPATQIDLTTLSKPELVQRAASAGVRGYSRMNKTTLIEHLS